MGGWARCRARKLTKPAWKRLGVCEVWRDGIASPGYIGFEAFEEIMIQRYAAQDPMDEIRKAFAA